MESNKTKRSIWTAIITAFFMCIGFVICRYFLFDLHGMKELPFVLFIFGIIVICTAYIFNSKRIMICTAIGYILSFFMGVLFQADWIDSHGIAMNSLWIWFVLGMITFIIIGVIWEFINNF